MSRLNNINRPPTEKDVQQRVYEALDSKSQVLRAPLDIREAANPHYYSLLTRAIRCLARGHAWHAYRTTDGIFAYGPRNQNNPRNIVKKLLIGVTVHKKEITHSGRYSEIVRLLEEEGYGLITAQNDSLKAAPLPNTSKTSAVVDEYRKRLLEKELEQIGPLHPLSLDYAIYKVAANGISRFLEPN